MISQALQQNKAINDQIFRVISTQENKFDDSILEIKRLLINNASTLKLIADNTPTQ
jgi:hypothetical protein